MKVKVDRKKKMVKSLTLCIDECFVCFVLLINKDPSTCLFFSHLSKWGSIHGLKVNQQKKTNEKVKK